MSGVDEKAKIPAGQTANPADLKNRLTRLREALTQASVGAFGDARRTLEDPAPDEIGTIEGLLQEFIFDYEAAIRQGEISIEEFRLSNRQLLSQIDTLSAPIIDVADDVVAIPLTGTIDGARLAEMSERLLHRIAASGISWVIIDLTGIGSVDPEPVEQLVRVAFAVRLMGARCLWTGMPPTVAKTLVALGTSVQGIITTATLKEGLRYCARRSR